MENFANSQGLSALQSKAVLMDFEPPFQGTCKTLLQNPTRYHDKLSDVDQCELPVIDLNNLNFGHTEREKIVHEVAQAASQWGFFQVVNHGFHRKFYRWGNPEATCLKQFSWSEAFHISTTEIPTMSTEHKSLRSTIEAFVKTVSGLARSLAEILAQPLGIKPIYFEENCPARTSYLRLNRYAPCPFSSQVYGLISHTDTDFLTIVYQDQVGGLEIYKDGRWLGVKPNPEALIVNIGDFLRMSLYHVYNLALSNGIYKSIKHRVVTSQKVERFSVAYFYCPSYDVVIKSCGKPALYRQFTLREYKQQTQIDVQEIGEKVGLSRFLL
ncbi:gibberellin 2-oxidase 8 [Prunus dulcis]|uniref:Gibberellin 2-oxidase 8 n=1 Tax=Prunus dulcis TaxID=3755 RepID=A0A4Y1RD42_PRUDU|nr:gibberellin 2-oxidase 8 [Prunus dulcis]